MRRIILLFTLLGCMAGLALAQPRPFADDDNPSWSALTRSQRAALAPLQRDWPTIDAADKQQWLEMAGRFPAMTPDEQARVQDRMSTWSRLSPQQRNRARLQYQEARQISPQERQTRWQAYQALPPEQRQELARRATPTGSRAAARGGRADRSGAAAPAPKANIVPNPTDAGGRRPVAPNVVQAQPGATTTQGSRPASPPPHQQTGLPKIAATPGFVDSATLLPKRGPQGAAVRPVQGNPESRRGK